MQKVHATTVYLLQQCVATFLNVVESMKNEAVVVKLPTAPQLKEFLERFNDNPDFELLAVELFTLLERCFLPDQLKSITKGHMWSAFHQLRLSDQPWRRFMARSYTSCSPESACRSMLSVDHRSTLQTYHHNEEVKATHNFSYTSRSQVK